MWLASQHRVKPSWGLHSPHYLYMHTVACLPRTHSRKCCYRSLQLTPTLWMSLLGLGTPVRALSRLSALIWEKDR